MPAKGEKWADDEDAMEFDAPIVGNQMVLDGSVQDPVEKISTMHDAAMQADDSVPSCPITFEESRTIQHFDWMTHAIA